MREWLRIYKLKRQLWYYNIWRDCSDAEIEERIKIHDVRSATIHGVLFIFKRVLPYDIWTYNIDQMNYAVKDKLAQQAQEKMTEALLRNEAELRKKLKEYKDYTIRVLRACLLKPHGENFAEDVAQNDAMATELMGMIQGISLKKK